MTYIVVSSNEIVKAEMEKPKGHQHFYECPCDPCATYTRYLLSLPRIAIQGDHKWEVWQEVPESEVGIKYEKRSWFSESLWLPSSKEEYDHIRPEIRRIVAIPIEQTKSEQGEKAKCNGNCGMNYCDEYGCIDNKPKGDVSHLITPLEEIKLDSNTIRLIERLKELQPYHIAPYNLGDEGEVSAIIDKLANLLTNDNPHEKI